MGEAGDAEETCRLPREEFVRVRRKDLERLTTEVMQIRDFLPRILQGDVLHTAHKLRALESNLERKERELEQLRADCEHFRARLQVAQAEGLRERKEKLAVRRQLCEARQQLERQAAYCTEMGAAACTLLWGATSSEDVVKAMLAADKALKFFSITGQTMESFVKSLDGDVKELDSDENQFVFALAGIVTNVAAIACGREFLVSSSHVLLDTILQLLGDLKPGQCTKLKVPRRRGVPARAAPGPVAGAGARGLRQGGRRAARLPAAAPRPGHDQEPQPPAADRGAGAAGGPAASGPAPLGCPRRPSLPVAPGPLSCLFLCF
ncbi:heat shock factor 2-binding protein isoform X2 [Erinaceus europaeus]|uniref:Heat shock factor 2-binding protein isoform X2 n=1 Tax=Erinaceus europaeus TaxID=9365 RepID=A0ABM3Y135_ERIEU|nr:heat shock factor 2-binding protein isoform X2 [Erinaceus europaeus]